MDQQVKRGVIPMPFSVINTNAAFSHGPHAGSSVAVHFPENFNPANPFALCVFLHGLSLDEAPFEKHIEMAIAQIKSSPTNTVLVAPRFGGKDDEGSFRDAKGFSSFVGELQTVLPPLLVQAGLPQADASRIATYAAAKAPIVLVGFSGGWRPLNAVLNGLLAVDGTSELAKATRCADRVVGVVLLDSIYGSTSSSGPIAWQKSRRTQTALLSIYGRNTGDNAKASNTTLISTLRAMGPVLTPASWQDLSTFPAGTAAFFEVATSHLSIPRDGPPHEPVAAFLTLLGDRLSAFPTS
jgi:hypothetical protein